MSVGGTHCATLIFFEDLIFKFMKKPKSVVDDSAKHLLGLLLTHASAGVQVVFFSAFL